ncbi:hypothetical protein ERC79_14805 [Rhodococcus sp. ABRD24]|uniref:DUF4232 domain-containing protein n=1 Tax=Rhodococcus sp. ABRD24 TaxID=2507582 RepID=UPI00103E6BA8|nr:DUF4232 domain-containing protein [Rhodococcus sp. ABRD24]QBJ97074.1 hypothetical protein ERC79_14805 [Rhodococcus sp. ABRD24]
MLEPNGPLPPEIYWRRRALAIGGVIVVVALLVWIIASVRGGGDDAEAASAASTSELTATSTSAVPPSSGDSVDGGASGANASGANASGTGVSGTSAAATTSGTPSGQQCSDQSLAVKVTTDQPQYQAGQEPGFTIVITNIGSSACERDLGSGFQQALVYTLDGNKRLWSNVDCYPNSDPELRTLEPGGQAAFAVKWSAATSEPGCAAPRNKVPPGAYTVVAQLGALRSAPEPFNIA